MTAQICLNILRKIKDVAFATVDESGLPQIRIIDVMLVENEKLYFCTARGKDFYLQLMRSGNVAVTGMNSQYQMIRLNGKAERLTAQKEWIDRIFKANPSMNTVYPGKSRYILEPFCIAQGEVEFFDLGISPIFRRKFPFGGSPERHSGFHITNNCIGCGKCQNICPQRCITEGMPYKIQQENCLHCGLCSECCPTHSIVKEVKP